MWRGWWGRGDAVRGITPATTACPADVIEAIQAVLDYIGDDERRDYEDSRRMCHVFESIARIESWLVDLERLRPIRGST